MQEYAFIVPILIVQAILGIALTVLAVRGFREAKRPQPQVISIESSPFKSTFRRTGN